MTEFDYLPKAFSRTCSLTRIIGVVSNLRNSSQSLAGC